ncbi:MAG: aspartate kinase [Deltaproteobacteria bacterium]|nr:aspartate kinase [Deltaproteobacteria bacterium]
MSLIVQKYGGTSVANIDRIKNVAQRVLKTQRAGNQVVVVVSAMSGETNRLLGLANHACEMPNERELDVIASTGEQVTTALLSMCIHQLGGEAISLQGHQVKILTDNAFSKARILSIDAEILKKYLSQGQVVVVAGFQGVDSEGHITTLGRGGSDTTGVALAAALKADSCEIYTDVDGVYTTDPNICERAQKIEKVSYEEMLEMASVGAKVLQIRSVEFGAKYNVPIHVRSSFNENPGTLVCQEDSTMESVVVTAIAYDKNEVKIAVRQVPDKPGVAMKVFSPIALANINVDMIVQNVSEKGATDLTFTVPKADFKKALQIVNAVAKDIGAEKVESYENIAKVSIIGVGMRSHAGVAAKTFEVLAKEGINIQMISTSEIKISLVIEDKYTELAVRTLHTAFGLDKK